MKINLTARIPHASNGFSLVELLVAMALGVLLLFGALQIFNSTRLGNQIQTAMASVQDGGRIAMEFISRDIRLADFSGCVRDKSRITNHLNPGGANYDPEVHQYYELGGISGVESASGLSIDGLSVVDGTSTLTIVGAQPACSGITAITSGAEDEDDPLQLRDASCVIEAGTVLMVSSCNTAEIFVKTNAGVDATIEHAAATTVGGLSNNSASFEEVYKSDSQILTPFVRQYFVAQGSNGNNSLFRRDNGVNQEVIFNVGDFQISYGRDGDGDLVADNFSSSFTAAEMAGVVTVQVELTVQSDELVNDNDPLERTYRSTTNIRNRVVRSETNPDA